MNFLSVYTEADFQTAIQAEWSGCRLWIILYPPRSACCVYLLGLFVRVTFWPPPESHPWSVNVGVRQTSANICFSDTSLEECERQRNAHQLLFIFVFIFTFQNHKAAFATFTNCSPFVLLKVACETRDFNILNAQRQRKLQWRVFTRKGACTSSFCCSKTLCSAALLRRLMHVALISSPSLLSLSPHWHF